MKIRHLLVLATVSLSVSGGLVLGARGRGGFGSGGFGGGMGGFGGDWSKWSQQSQAARKAEEAKAKAADAEKKLKERVGALLAEGWSNLQAGDTPAAIETFFDVLELKPDESEARLGIGMARASNGEWTLATKQLDMASKAPATKRLGLYNLAVMYSRQNLKPRASATLHTFLAANPKPVDEMVLNAQRTLLSQMDETVRKGIGLLPNILRVVADADVALAATYTGQERFGVAWVPTGYASLLRKAGKVDLYPAELPYVMPNGSVLKGKKGSSTELVNALLPSVAASLVRETIASAGLAVPSETVASAEKPTGTTPTTSPTAPVAPGVPTDPVAATPPNLARPGRPLEKPVLSRNDPAPAMPTPAPADPTPAVTPPATPDVAPPTVVASVTVRGAAFCVAPGILATCARTVQGATLIRVAGTDSNPVDGEIITIDEASGLALIKVPGNFKPLPLADAFRNGSAMVACFARTGLFGPDLEVLHGDLLTVAGKHTLRMTTHPRLPGAPVVDDKGRVIAICSATRDDAMATLPVISVEKLRALAEGKFTPATSAVDPDEAVVEITVTRKP